MHPVCETVREQRTALLGIAAGICFAAAAVLTKGVVQYLGDGIFAWIPHWESYALAAAASGGVIGGQSAFQTGALAASVGATEATAPVAAAILGLVLLDSVDFDSADQISRRDLGDHGPVRDRGAGPGGGRRGQASAAAPAGTAASVCGRNHSSGRGVVGFV